MNIGNWIHGRQKHEEKSMKINTGKIDMLILGRNVNSTISSYNYACGIHKNGLLPIPFQAVNVLMKFIKNTQIFLTAFAMIHLLHVKGVC